MVTIKENVKKSEVNTCFNFFSFLRVYVGYLGRKNLEAITSVAFTEVKPQLLLECCRFIPRTYSRFLDDRL